MEENNIVKYEGGIIKRISNQIGVTNKLLALSEPLLIPYRKGDKWGFCTADKKIVIDCQFEGVGFFNNGLAWVKQNGKYGSIDKDVNIKIAFLYDSSYFFRDGIARVRENKIDKFIDINGNVLDFYETFRSQKKPTYQILKPSADQDGNWGFYDRNIRKQIIDYKYEGANPFFEDLASVCLNNKWGFIDKEENIIIPFNYDWATIFVGGIAAVKENNKYGFIDKSANTILPFIYEDAHNFYSGLASVQLNDKWGFINKKGVVIIDCIYDYASSFKGGGLVEVEFGDKYAYFNKEGVEYWED